MPRFSDNLLKMKGRLSVIVLLFLSGLAGASLLFMDHTRSMIQCITLKDGSELRFLGITHGTNHWNPRISPLAQKLCELGVYRPITSKLVALTRPKLPVGAPMFIEGPRMDILWLESSFPLTASRYLVGRLVNESGAEFGQPLDLNDQRRFSAGPTTTCSPLMLQPEHLEQLKTAKAVRVYERDRPLPSMRPIEGPVPDFVWDLYFGSPQGEFRLR